MGFCFQWALVALALIAVGTDGFGISYINPIFSIIFYIMALALISVGIDAFAIICSGHWWLWHWRCPWSWQGWGEMIFKVFSNSNHPGILQLPQSEQDTHTYAGQEEGEAPKKGLGVQQTHTCARSLGILDPPGAATRSRNQRQQSCAPQTCIRNDPRKPGWICNFSQQ